MNKFRMIKKIGNIAIFVMLTSIFVQCTSDPFEQYFTDETLRIDYFHIGDANSEIVEIEKKYKYKGWAGSTTYLIDSLNHGGYYYKVVDKSSGKTIYSKYFNSFFMEYKSTNLGVKGVSKKYHETALIPFPKSAIEFSLEIRDEKGGLTEVFKTTFEPSSVEKKVVDPDVQVFTSLENGVPNKKADILFVGEGYTIEESEKFQQDLERFTNTLFTTEPFKSNKDFFNVRGVFKPSVDSGVDEPLKEIDKNTSISATFNTFNSARYLLTEDNKSLRDIAGHAPYDAIAIMVNHDRYGGGGIYNFYCVFTTNNEQSDFLLLHEFGHSFIGLGDEYYSSSTGYTDFHSLENEPFEPNLTALKDPANVKWKHLLSEGIEVPTKWQKKKYDSLEIAIRNSQSHLQMHLAKLKKNGAKQIEIELAENEHNSKIQSYRDWVDHHMEDGELKGKVGVFEGAGYQGQGLYRPSVNCIMFKYYTDFCPVCQDAIKRTINTYSK